MTLAELIAELDERIHQALIAKATGETIVHLCEARAWLTNPDQPHGALRQA
ncbi:MAG: hypothetical protein ABSC34_04520 [Acidimicrobiales bacterium]|jgi:hypothetical protein